MESKKVVAKTERWVQLWILGFALIAPGKAVLDLTGIEMATGTWKAPITLPCVYEPSADFKELKVIWKFSRQGEGPRSIFLRDSSGDQTFLVAFKGRISVAEKPPGDISLHIKELEMPDIGAYTCSVEWEANNMSIIIKEKTVQLNVVKVPASKPAIKPSILESVLPNGIRMSLTCSANGSLPIQYSWYKERPGKDAEHLQRGAVLAFGSLQVSDSARYFCTAENRLSVQKEQSDSFQLTVKDASEFSTAGPGTEPGEHPTDASEFSTAGPGTEPGEHPTETVTTAWKFKRRTMTATRKDGVVTSPTPLGVSSGQQGLNPPKTVLPLYITILIAVLCVAFVLVVGSVVFCRRKARNGSIYQVTYNNNALNLANDDILASPGVNGACMYEEPNLNCSNNYTLEPTNLSEYAVMGEKKDNEYELMVNEKHLGN